MLLQLFFFVIFFFLKTLLTTSWLAKKRRRKKGKKGVTKQFWRALLNSEDEKNDSNFGFCFVPLTQLDIFSLEICTSFIQADNLYSRLSPTSLFHSSFTYLASVFPTFFNLCSTIFKMQCNTLFGYISYKLITGQQFDVSITFIEWFPGITEKKKKLEYQDVTSWIKNKIAANFFKLPVTVVLSLGF